MTNDLRGAFAFLTVLPTGNFSWGKPGRIFSYFPLVGLVIGLILASAGSLEGLAPDVRAFLMLVAWVALTGGLHLDGFGDACDGLFATVSPERRLEIMKDSRAGSWAVIGLCLILLGKWVMLRDLDQRDIILPPVIGRWAMVLAASGFAYGRQMGTGGHFRDGFGRTQLLTSTILTVVIVILTGWPASATIIVAPAIVFTCGTWASRRLGGGLTGDVYGALCELTELGCLIMLGMI